MSSNPSRIHALVIGINKYKHNKYRDLRGCVADANAIKHYLIQDLSVPEDQIVCLLDEQATRRGILDAFNSHLTCNPNIKCSDPIVIYFSGEDD